MKLNTKDFVRRSQFPLMLAAGSLPVPMLICGMEMPEQVNACLGLAGLFVALSWLCVLTPGRLRVPVGALCAAGMAAVSAMLLPFEPLFPALLIPVMYALMLLLLLQVGGWEPGRELHPLAGALCLVAHMVAQFLVNIDRQNRAAPMYEPVTLPLTVSFIVFGAFALLAMNRSSLNSAVNGRANVPTSMRRKNRLLTAGLLALVLAVASLPAVIRAIGKAWEWIKLGLLAIVRFILSLFPQGDDAAGNVASGGDMGMLAAETSEQSLLSLIIEKIILVIAIIVIAVLVVVAARIVWRKLKVLLKVLWARLNDYMVSSSEDYVDEISDTRDDAEHDRAPRRSRRRLIRSRVDENALSPQQRIRYRYLQAWLRHPEWTPERTARENIAEDAAQLYERARYSSHDVTEREAEDFAQKLNARKG